MPAQCASTIGSGHAPFARMKKLPDTIYVHAHPQNARNLTAAVSPEGLTVSHAMPSTASVLKAPLRVGVYKLTGTVTVQSKIETTVTPQS